MLFAWVGRLTCVCAGRLACMVQMARCKACTHVCRHACKRACLHLAAGLHILLLQASLSQPPALMPSACVPPSPWNQHRCALNHSLTLQLYKTTFHLPLCAGSLEYPWRPQPDTSASSQAQGQQQQEPGSSSSSSEGPSSTSPPQQQSAPAAPELKGMRAKTWFAGTDKDAPRNADGSFVSGWHWNMPYGIRTELPEWYKKEVQRYSY